MQRWIRCYYTGVFFFLFKGIMCHLPGLVFGFHLLLKIWILHSCIWVFLCLFCTVFSLVFFFFLNLSIFSLFYFGGTSVPSLLCLISVFMHWSLYVPLSLKYYVFFQISFGDWSSLFSLLIFLPCVPDCFHLLFIIFTCDCFLILPVCHSQSAVRVDVF